MFGCFLRNKPETPVPTAPQGRKSGPGLKGGNSHAVESEPRHFPKPNPPKLHDQNRDILNDALEGMTTTMKEPRQLDHTTSFYESNVKYPPTQPTSPTYTADSSAFSENRSRSRDNSRKGSSEQIGSRRKVEAIILSPKHILTFANQPQIPCLTGLANLGNTCYMNSVLQCLSKTPGLCRYFAKKLEAKYATNSDTVLAFGELLREMYNVSSESLNSAVAPQALKVAVGSRVDRFATRSQQDSQEYLRTLLDLLHEDMNRVKEKPPPPKIDEKKEDAMGDAEKSRLMFSRYQLRNSSIFVDLFCGQLRSAVTCLGCGHVSTTFDVFWDLSIPVPKGTRVSLEGCLDMFCEEEHLHDEERYMCPRCKRKCKCTKRVTLYTLPKILVIHLKRFSATSMFSLKVQTAVTVPPILNLTPFVTSPDSAAVPLYEWYGVSSHHGITIRSGHYTAQCKDLQQQQWFSFDDSRVSSLPSLPHPDTDTYVLFYCRKD